MPRRARPSLPALAGTALVSAAAAVLIVRNFFPAEKKIRKPIFADYGPRDPEFLRTMSQLLGPPLLGGNKVTALHNGAQYFPAMLGAIRAAERTITFENFVLWEGRIVDAFAEALAARARAGVRVHFLQDAIGCDCLHGEAIRLMKRSGVEVEIFRHLHLSRINQRTHRKLLVIDGRIGFTGGAGIADEWDGNADAPLLWRDSQYQLEGPAVAQMQQAFMDNWMQTRAVVLHGDSYFPELAPAGDLVCQVFKSSAGEGADSARVMYLISIAAARGSIRIANPYFIPDDLTIEMLVRALRRGVEIEVITPGPLIDNHIARQVGRARWGPLLEAGARFYEFQPAQYHCKYMIVDDCWVSVGSSNFDNRSFRLNEEANLNVLDERFGAENVRVFEDDKARCKEVPLREWRRRPVREKLIGRAAGLLRAQM